MSWLRPTPVTAGVRSSPHVTRSSCGHIARFAERIRRAKSVRASLLCALLFGIAFPAFDQSDSPLDQQLVQRVRDACPSRWESLRSPGFAEEITVVDPWQGDLDDRRAFVEHVRAAGLVADPGAGAESIASDPIAVIAECSFQKLQRLGNLARTAASVEFPRSELIADNGGPVSLPDGSTPEQAATSCDFIKLAFPNAAVGDYWIDPDSRGSAVAEQHYCEFDLPYDGSTQVRAVRSCDDVAGANPAAGPGYYWIDETGGSAIDAERRFCDIEPMPDGTAPELAALSCKSIKDAYPGSTSGAYWLDVNGGGTEDAFRAWCDMDSASGGWTLVAAQFEADPLTDWGEGIQADYDPSLSSRRSFTLSGAELPAHAETAFGRDLEATYVDYADFVYSTGNLDKRLLFGKKRGVSYHVHRDAGYGYAYGNPEEGSSTSESVRNRFTFDEVGGRQYTWCYTPNYSQSLRGYTLFGYRGWYTDDFAWTVWVR